MSHVVFLAYLSVYHCVQCLLDQSPGPGYLGMEPGSSSRAAGSLNHLAISLASHLAFFGTWSLIDLAPFALDWLTNELWASSSL